MKTTAGVLVIAVCAILSGALALEAQQQKIYWGDEVPAGWTGTWPARTTGRAK